MSYIIFSCFRVEWGWVAVMSSDTGFVKMTLPAPDEQSAIDAISHGLVAERREADFAELKSFLIDYFSGKPVNPNFRLDLNNHTPFRRNVWESASRIPYGQLRSYGWLAAEIGQPGAARAVGQALGLNPLPIIIPCHRVVCSDGSLGGFSGGLNWKRRLINLEKAMFIPHKHPLVK